MARKSNTEILSKRRYTDTPQGRDVYNRQRLERGQMEDPQTMTSRAILCVVAAVFVFALVYGVWSGVASLREHAARNSLYKSEQAAFKAWQEANPNPVAVMGPDGVLIYEGDPPPELTIEKPAMRVTFGPRSMNHLFISLVAGLLTFAGMYQVMQKNLKAQNMMRDMTDVNMWDNDQHVALPEEIQAEYDWFPDVGAHSRVQVSSMLSHMMLQNKGLKTVKMAKRYKADVKDERGVVVHFKGEIVTDDNGEPVLVDKPIIDEAFGTALFEASEADPEVRKFYDVRRVPYNPDGKNRDKLSGYKTVADLINGDWYLPVYEPQRPAGAYIVDTAPVNTMILAITRAGKGQWFGPFTRFFRYQRGLWV